MEFVDFATIFSVAFLGSLGHCIGMCGGFVVMYTSSYIKKDTSSFKQFLVHATYNTGRISSYVILGIVFGYIGSVLSISKTVHGYLFFIIGIIMVLIGLSLLGKIRFLQLLEARPFSKFIIKKISTFLKNMNSFFGLYILGMLNGFIPCGLVYFFLVSAVASSSVYYGGLTMLIFGLVTLPSMLGFGYFIGVLTQNRYRDIMIKVASIIVIAYGIYTAFNGYMMVMESR